jgi:hypothetical protein
LRAPRRDDPQGNEEPKEDVLTLQTLPPRYDTLNKIVEGTYIGSRCSV